MMKKYFLIGFISTMVLSASDASAQFRHHYANWRYYRDYDYYHNSDSKHASEKKSNSEDNDKDEHYRCYDAWKKDFKREKKAYKAEQAWYEDRPEAAFRKRRKADKKAWKSDMIEHEHKYGYNYYYYRH